MYVRSGNKVDIAQTQPTHIAVNTADTYRNTNAFVLHNNDVIVLLLLFSLSSTTSFDQAGQQQAFNRTLLDTMYKIMEQPMAKFSFQYQKFEFLMSENSD